LLKYFGTRVRLPPPPPFEFVRALSKEYLIK